MSATAGVMVTDAIAEAVAPLAGRAAGRQQCEVVEVRFLTGSRGWVLRIVIDKDGGVDVEDCASVSRQLAVMLDVEDVVPYAYTLEVSSPGLDEFLLVAADYRRYAGRRVRVQSREPIAGSGLFRGKLRGFRRGIVLLEDESGAPVNIPLNRVAEARLEVEIEPEPTGSEH